MAILFRDMGRTSSPKSIEETGMTRLRSHDIVVNVSFNVPIRRRSLITDQGLQRDCSTALDVTLRIHVRGLPSVLGPSRQSMGFNMKESCGLFKR